MLELLVPSDKVIAFHFGCFGFIGSLVPLNNLRLAYLLAVDVKELDFKGLNLEVRSNSRVARHNQFRSIVIGPLVEVIALIGSSSQNKLCAVLYLVQFNNRIRRNRSVLGSKRHLIRVNVIFRIYIDSGLHFGVIRKPFNKVVAFHFGCFGSGRIFTPFYHFRLDDIIIFVVELDGEGLDSEGRGNSGIARYNEFRTVVVGPADEVIAFFRCRGKLELREVLNVVHVSDFRIGRNGAVFGNERHFVLFQLEQSSNGGVARHNEFRAIVVRPLVEVVSLVRRSGENELCAVLYLVHIGDNGVGSDLSVLGNKHDLIGLDLILRLNGHILRHMVELFVPAGEIIAFHIRCNGFGSCLVPLNDLLVNRVSVLIHKGHGVGIDLELRVDIEVAVYRF